MELADLLAQLSFLGLALLFVLALLAWRKQLTGTIQQLLLPLTHLNRMDSRIGDDLLDRIGATDRPMATLDLIRGCGCGAYSGVGAPMSGAIHHLRG